VSAEPATHELEVFQGAYWSQRLEWQDSALAPIDLTGYTARMQVRRTIISEEVLLLLETDPAPGGGLGNGRITLGDPLLTDGVILLEVEAGATATLPATPFDRRWRYDLELVPAGGQVRRLMMGKFKVSLEVTR
jgi:hypothetical protein